MCLKTGILWEKFVLWARSHGIEFRFPEEYDKYWKCYFDAVMAERENKNMEVIND
ncbi:MAG TPA: hypothetical protein VMW42_06210 [Desulfatiglandales bacterium]|nr:hypothetical protein [Desulfatiglandales bacterium]